MCSALREIYGQVTDHIDHILLQYSPRATEIYNIIIF